MAIFPEVDRVIYQQNPLAQVLCQLQFDELLEIGADEPVEFQKAIREDYPVFERSSPDGSENPPHYKFVSPEGHWSVSLTTNHVALTTSDYVRWEEFRERLSEIRSTFQEIYDVPRYSRIGLRYTDIIERSELGLEDSSWGKLIKEDVAGLSVADRFREHLLSHEQRTELELQPEEPRVHLGLIFAIGNSDEYEEEVAAIDADLFCPEPTRPDDAEETLETLHGYSGRIFRGCITKSLHEALEPKPVGE